MSDPLAFARDLIAFPSVTPNGREALDWVEHQLTVLGFRFERLVFGPPEARVETLYATWGNPQARRNLLFAGHVDVVPVGDGWTKDPFAAVVSDGKLYGRGAIDMKGAVACYLSACLDTLPQLTVTDTAYSLLLTADEEGPALHGTQPSLAELSARGERWSACLTGEPTCRTTLGDCYKPGRRGSLQLTLDITGKQGHTGYPQFAHNAAHTMAAVLAELTATPLDAGDDDFQPSNLEVWDIKAGGLAANIIPGAAHCGINIRYSPRFTADSLYQEVQARIDTALQRLAGSQPTHVALQQTGNFDPYFCPTHPLITVLEKACHAITGQTPQASTQGGTSDSRFIQRYCPVVDFGLLGQTLHQADEHTPVADLYALKAIYAEVITRWNQLDKSELAA